LRVAVDVVGERDVGAHPGVDLRAPARGRPGRLRGAAGGAGRTGAGHGLHAPQVVLALLRELLRVASVLRFLLLALLLFFLAPGLGHETGFFLLLREFLLALLLRLELAALLAFAFQLRPLLLFGLALELALARDLRVALQLRVRLRRRRLHHGL